MGNPSALAGFLLLLGVASASPVSAQTPGLVNGAYERLSPGNQKIARALFEKMFPVIEFVFVKSGVRAIHTALDILGRPAGAPRRPIRMLGKEERATLEKLLRGCEDLIR